MKYLLRPKTQSEYEAIMTEIYDGPSDLPYVVSWNGDVEFVLLVTLRKITEK